MKRRLVIPAVRSLKNASQLRKVLCCYGFVKSALWATVLVVGVACVPRAFAQASGSVSGHVSDPTGANLPDTQITLTEVNTQSVRSTRSTNSGDYTFTDVPPGTYKLQIQHEGFKTAQSDTFPVQISQGIRLNFTLQVGAVSQSIDVTAAGALLQSDNASLGTVVENQEIKELPLNGRNYLGLVGLSSNVNTLSSISGQANSRLGGDRAGQSIAVGGQRIMFDYYTLDGVNNTDPDFNTYIALPSIDAIQEFKVQTGVYSASSATKRLRSTSSPRVVRISTMAPHLSSSGTTMWMLGPTGSQNAIRRVPSSPSTLSSTTTSDSSLTVPSEFRNCSMAETNSFS